MNITVIGCGHGGCALAAHLTQKNQKVTLYADEEHPGYIDKLCDDKLRLTGKLVADAVVHKLTKDISEAVNEAEVIYLALPTEAHLPQFRKMLPYLKPGQMVLTLAGNFSSLYFYKELCQVGLEQEVIVADFASLPYACRMQPSGEVQVLAVKAAMEVAAMPATKTLQVIERAVAHFPTALVPSKHVLALGLGITSAISHPTIMLMNAGRIGADQQDFYFYKEGISPEVALIVQELDEERMAIGRRYGLDLPGYLKLMNGFYQTDFKTYHEFFSQSRVHNQQKLCPSSVHERYLSQDVPALLVAWQSLADKVGIETKVMRSIIDLASVLNGKAYRDEGRDLVRDLFLALSVEQVCSFMETGVLGGVDAYQYVA